MKEKIVIIGAEGTALNIIEQIIDAARYSPFNKEIAGIIIDNYERGILISGIPVIGNTAEIKDFLYDDSLYFIFALFKPGEMRERFELLQSFNIPRGRFTNFIHPSVYLSASVIQGLGNVVLSNSTIQSNVVLGDFNIISSNVTVEHETTFGNGNFLAANSCIGSKVKIGNHCFIGLNASVRENVNIGDNVFIGMHSLVLNNFNDCTIAGIPASEVKDVRIS
jgi:sugar O-acyltransferase (sialic acid O-acetyltransferase NeuD family)